MSRTAQSEHRAQTAHAALASYRRRPDGILEIVRPPSPMRELGVAVAIAFSVLAVVIALAAVLAVYLVIGVPLVLAGGGFLLVRLWRRRSRPQHETTEAPEAEPASLGSSAGTEAREARRPLLLSIPGTAASRRE